VDSLRSEEYERMVNGAIVQDCLYNFAVHPLRRRFAVAKDEWSGAYFLSVVSITNM
jgi:hypothetical protein